MSQTPAVTVVIKGGGYAKEKQRSPESKGVVLTEIIRRQLSAGVGAMLAEARNDRKWTLAMAAGEIGCSVSFLWHLERARRAPSAAMAGAIVEAYGLGPDEVQRLMAESVTGAGRSKTSKRRAAANA